MFVLRLLCLVVVCRAVPFLPQTPRSSLRSRDNETTEISDALLGNFKLFANFTAAAYCLSNEISNNTLITCSISPCPLVEADQVTSIVEFGGVNDTASVGIKGFVAVDLVKKLLVVAFAGSGATVRNWVADFLFLEVAYDLDGCDYCYIHSGFSTGWEERRSLILSTVVSALAANPTYSLVITGHSIGAALATLAGTELRNMGYEADTYTFGSPRIGNAAFAAFVTGQSPALGQNYRMTHINDPVPQLPPMWIGYEHTSPEYWLSDGTDVTDVYEVGDVVVCEGLGNKECNAGTGLVPIDEVAHSHYLGEIDGCQGSLSW